MLTGTTTHEDEPPGRSTAPVAAEAREQFASSPRGARLARRFAVRCMEVWGHPPASDVSCAIALVVGELAANAVQHGRVPGHDFGLRLTLNEVAGLVRVEVADAAATKRPPAAAPSSHPEGESGRGLLLVEALAVRWGSAPRLPLGKTMWAEMSAEAPTHL
ncbi:ATP-binding protein [Streptomyces sp. NPDC086080]|uniref:ATP-binding protein n=1 Tax=Streptomyces sp. NPDC086080 TaxID=3365748 RepID=UPI0037D6D961